MAAGAGLAGLAVSAAGEDGLVYYRTPTELAADPDDDVVRVGGLVVPGSVTESGTGSTLVLTDGATDVPVSYPHRLPDVVREGEGAVVEGRVDDRGVLHADELLMRHSNEYRAPEPADAVPEDGAQENRAP